MVVPEVAAACGLSPGPIRETGPKVEVTRSGILSRPARLRGPRPGVCGTGPGAGGCFT